MKEEEGIKRKWTLWQRMRIEWKDYKRKDGPQQKSYHEKYTCNKRKDHNNDNPYAQDYIPEKHTQLTGQTTWSAHEVRARHSMCYQKLEGGHI